MCLLLWAKISEPKWGGLGQKRPVSLTSRSGKWPFSTPRSLPSFLSPIASLSPTSNPQIPPFHLLPTCLSTVSALACSLRERERERGRNWPEIREISHEQRARTQAFEGNCSQCQGFETKQKKLHKPNWSEKLLGLLRTQKMTSRSQLLQFLGSGVNFSNPSIFFFFDFSDPKFFPLSSRI